MSSSLMNCFKVQVARLCLYNTVGSLESVPPLSLIHILTSNWPEGGDPETPVPELVGDAVSVTLRAVVLNVIPEKVASPEELVLAEAPEAIEIADGVRVTEMLSGAALPNWSSTWTLSLIHI